MRETQSDTQATKRRSIIKSTGVGIATLVAGCSGNADSGVTDTTQQPTTDQPTSDQPKTTTVRPQSLHTIQSEGSILVPIFLYGITNDAWTNHGIDLSFEASAYGKYSRQLVANLSKVGGLGPPTAVNFANEGEDLTMYGMVLNLSVGMFAKADSEIEAVEDLADKKLAVPPLYSAATNANKAMIQSSTGFNILEDTANTRASAPPTLLPLLRNDEVDAVLLYSGDTISAAADGALRQIFDPISVWKDQTGYPPQAANFTSYRPWLEENAVVAKRFLAGWEDAATMFMENIDEAITNFGRLGGVTTDGEAQVVKEWVNAGRIIPPFKFSQEAADNNWKLIEAMAEYGSAPFDSLPDRDSFLTTTTELEEMAK